VTGGLALEQCPEVVSEVWARGLPLEGFLSAPECAEEDSPGVPHALEPVVIALAQLLSDGKPRSQRAVLRDMARQFKALERSSPWAWCICVGA
jgi:hypothetical protein